MLDIEKVISILERHKSISLGDMACDGIQFTLGNVADLLKEQHETRVLAFNINDFVKVKLTNYGHMVHSEYYRKYLGDKMKLSDWLPFSDGDGFAKYQLWEFMQIFGDHMFNGAEQVIEKNLIYLEI